MISLGIFSDDAPEIRAVTARTFVPSNVRSKRILEELDNLAANPHPLYDVYCSEITLGFFKVVVEGPAESIYRGGTFMYWIDLPERFPAHAPQVRYVTPIHHPNTNRHGLVCHAIVGRDWTTDTSLLMLMNSIFSLLMVPEVSDPANLMVAQEHYHDPVEFSETAQASIRKHAQKTRAQWRVELTGEEGADGIKQEI